MKSKRHFLFGRLWPYLLKYKRLWIAGVVSIALSNLFLVASPWILKSAIDSLSKQVTASALATYAAAILGVTIISGVFTYFMRQTMIVASRRIEYDFRNDFFAHLLTLDRPYYDKTPTGDIMARSTNDMDSVRNMIGPGITYLCATVVGTILILSLMIKISLKLTLLSIIPLPVIGILVIVLGREVNKRYTKIQEQYSTMTARAQENFSGIRVVKAYVQEQAEIKDFSDMGVDYIRKNMSMIKIWGMFFPAIVLFSGVAVVMVLWFGGKAVVSGTITLGSFVAFIAYLLMLVWPIASLGWVVGLWQRGLASLVRMEEILNARPTIVDQPNAVTREIKGKIEFRDLSFSYDSAEILKNISVLIEPGMNVAIIGDTGSGKSTLVSLLTRAYPVERGMIFVDDIEINDYALESVRSQIVPVMQETFLFSETIRSNIAYGNYDLSLDSIMKAANIAAISTEIDDFPRKYDTILGERGITLSGGQKQRTALARALAADPRVLILDDVFSSVDTHTEEDILTNLRQILKDRTTILISHRISTVKGADLILVMSGGRIVERGSHDELLAAGGHYAQLYERQLLREELEAL